MGALKEAVQNLVVYMLLITVILNLVKASSFRKYIELFTGLVLILILFTPIARLFSVEEVLTEALETNQFFMESNDSAEFIYEAESNTKDELLRIYSEKVAERIKLLGESNEVTVEKIETKISPAEEGFGVVEKIRVKVLQKEKKEEFETLLIETFALTEKEVIVE